MDDPASSLLLLFQTPEAHSQLSFTETVSEFALVLFIVGLNAFFVASEFALVSVRRTRVQKAFDETGSGGAAAVLRLLDNPTRFISAVQLGVTLASLGLGWVGEPTVAQLLIPLVDTVVGEGP